MPTRAPMPCYCALPAQASAASSVQGRLPTPPSRQRTGGWETPVSTAGQPVSCVLCSRPSRNPALSPANWGGWETPVSTAGQPVSCVLCSRPSAICQPRPLASKLGGLGTPCVHSRPDGELRPLLKAICQPRPLASELGGVGNPRCPCYCALHCC